MEGEPNNSRWDPLSSERDPYKAKSQKGKPKGVVLSNNTAKRPRRKEYGARGAYKPSVRQPGKMR